MAELLDLTAPDASGTSPLDSAFSRADVVINGVRNSFYVVREQAATGDEDLFFWVHADGFGSVRLVKKSRFSKVRFFLCFL